MKVEKHEMTVKELFEHITTIMALIIYIGFMFALLFWLVGII